MEQKHAVSEREAISFLGADVPPSLATAAMISRMEYTCRDAVLPHLESGQDTVGTRVNVEHLAATPLGKEVTYRAKLTAVDGRRLTFDVEAREDGEAVGRGTHERYVIDVARFGAGLKKRFGGEAVRKHKQMGQPQFPPTPVPAGSKTLPSRTHRPP